MFLILLLGLKWGYPRLTAYLPQYTKAKFYPLIAIFLGFAFSDLGKMIINIPCWYLA
jgi:hypothetical protein